MLILKCCPDGQAADLAYTSRNMLEHSLGMETVGCHHWDFPFPCFRVPVSPRRDLSHVSDVLIFLVAAQGNLLTAWLWRPGVIAFLVPWDCNGQCLTQKGGQTLVWHPDVCSNSQGTTSPSSGSQWGLHLEIPQD